MNIHEYQAKHILQKYAVPILEGVVILNKDDIDYVIDNFNAKIFVIKAQIHAGGRGIAGGVQVAYNKEDAKRLAHAMMGTSLITTQTHKEGQQVKRIYIEEHCDILQEYYFSLILDRDKEALIFIVSTEGGVDIEEVASNNAEKIITIPINPKIGLQEFHYRKLAIALGFNNDKATQLKKIAKGIYDVFVENNAHQIEINPLVVTKKGNLIVLDAKISFDDNSLFLHPEIMEMRDESEEDPLEIAAMNDRFNYIKTFGNIGCMVNGAGLAMATMDIIKLYRGEVANFLDVGGGADQARVTNAFKIILSDSKVKAILVNIFGGIVRCDIIAKAIVEAVYDIGIHVPLVVRLAGTNYQLGNDILKNSGLKIITALDLDEAASKIVAQVSMTHNEL